MKTPALIFALLALIPPPGFAGDLDLKLDKLLSDLYLKEGEKRVERGELPSGKFFLHESAEKDPFNARAYNLAGIAAVRSGRLKEAEAYFELATTADPLCAECRQNLASVFLARKKPDLALLAFYQTLRDPKYKTPWLPLYGMGLAYMAKRDYDRAVAMFDRVLNYTPKGLDGEIRAKINEAVYLKNRERLKETKKSTSP